MTNAARRLIKQGDILPPLSLDTGDGERISVPGNQATILIFTHRDSCDDCADYLVEAGTAVGDIGDWATRMIGVLPGGKAPGDIPFPVTADADGAARRRLGLPPDQAAVLLTDRWGEVFEVAAFDGDDHGFPLPRQLVESSKIVDISCGECNVPGPEWREGRD